MKRHTTIAFLASFSVFALALTVIATVRANPTLKLSASVAEQTHRRIFVLDTNIGWSSGVAVSYWGGSGGVGNATKVCTVDEGDLYYFDIKLSDISGGGFLFLDAGCVSGSSISWGTFDHQTDDAPALPEWGNADLYTISATTYGNKASCLLNGGIKLSESGSAALLSHYTSCASDLSGTSSSSYLSDILAYPQLQANFRIEEHLDKTTAVSSLAGGEKVGTTLGVKVATMREEFASLNLGADVYDGVKVYCQKASYDHVFAWGGGSTADWPGNAMTKYDSTWNVYDFSGLSMINLVFNDGNSSQSPDLYRAIKGIYYYYNGLWYSSNPVEPDDSSSASSEASSSSSVEANTYTVYCDTCYSNAYAFDDAENKLLGNWPGSALTAHNDKWKKVTITDTDSLTVIFNCGDGSTQSRDINVPSAGTYYYYNGVLSTSEPDRSVSTKETYDGIKVYCSTDYNYVWAWDGSGNLFDKWPGAKMSSDGYWSYYEFGGYSSLNMIFSNNGSSQTADLSRSAKGVYYYLDGRWYDENPTATAEPGLNILHCFDWPLSSITANLPAIKAAGFDAVQTSPLQQPIDYKSNWTDEYNQWWKLYQPLSFSIGDTAWVGNTSSLETLTAAADTYGIKVIVDVVANHMAGSNGSLDSGVSESSISGNTSQTLHSYSSNTSDDSVQAIVQGRLGIGGLPDLNTANSTVQERVLSYLKELVDAGADGFRFDAAKHIETPHDGTYASDFWVNTLGAARSYAGSDLFAYGEALNVNQQGRSTYDYIDCGTDSLANGANLDAITDDSTGGDIAAIINGRGSTSNSHYNSGLNAKATVLWAESHDTYHCGDGATSGYSQWTIDSTYALLSARCTPNMLYFCRPSGTMGTINSTLPWKDPKVIAANDYHHLFAGKASWNSASNGASIVENYGDGLYGATIVNPTDSAASVTLSHIDNGTYVDMVTGKSYAVSSNTLSVPASTTLILSKA